MNQRQTNGPLFMVIALVFGLGSFNYTLGTFDKPGPAMFPLMVSSALLLIGVINLFRKNDKTVNVNVKNIAIIVVSLAIFALASLYFGMLIGIVLLVLVSSVAGERFSIIRILLLSASLITVALMFNYVLGMNLPLWK
jgi:hypothetical protein